LRSAQIKPTVWQGANPLVANGLARDVAADDPNPSWLDFGDDVAMRLATLTVGDIVVRRTTAVS
jgi:hypothetical protein